MKIPSRGEVRQARVLNNRRKAYVDSYSMTMPANQPDQTTNFEQRLDEIMEDLITGHNFDYARTAILEANQSYGDRREAEGRKQVFAEYRAYKLPLCDSCGDYMRLTPSSQGVWTDYCHNCDRSKPCDHLSHDAHANIDRAFDELTQPPQPRNGNTSGK